MTSDYLKYRGKCKELCEQAIKEDASLKLVRGFYYCPIWNVEEMHWWTTRPDGSIFDPSAKQFASKGHGDYREFDGTYKCSECGKSVLEADAQFESNYVFCSDVCHMRFVGL